MSGADFKVSKRQHRAKPADLACYRRVQIPSQTTLNLPQKESVLSSTWHRLKKQPQGPTSELPVAWPDRSFACVHISFPSLFFLLVLEASKSLQESNVMDECRVFAMPSDSITAGRVQESFSPHAGVLD